MLLFFLEDDDSRAELQQLFVRVGIVLGDDRSFCSAQGSRALPVIGEPAPHAIPQVKQAGSIMPDVPLRRDQNDALPHLAGWNPEDWICFGLPGGADQAASHACRIAES